MSSENRKTNELVRQYLRAHPDCTYEQLLKGMRLTDFSKAYFYNLRRGVKEKAALPKKVAATKQASLQGTKTVEIVETIDAAGFSEELKSNFKTHFLPLLHKLIGSNHQMVFLADPPVIEIRKAVS